MAKKPPAKATSPAHPQIPAAMLRKILPVAKSPAEQRAAIWVMQNRGVLSRIAAQLEVTPQFVHMVLMGKRKSGNNVVEGALRKCGAPLVG